jgi:hypothetical protein
MEHILLTLQGHMIPHCHSFYLCRDGKLNCLFVLKILLSYSFLSTLKQIHWIEHINTERDAKMLKKLEEIN